MKSAPQPLLPFLLAGLLGAMGCEQLPWSTPKKASPDVPAPPVVPSHPVVPPTEVVVRVNAQVISTHDLELAIQDVRAATAAAGQTWTPLSAEEQPNQYDLHDLLNDLIVTELRAQDALARGLDRQTDFQRVFWYRVRSLFAQEWLRWQLHEMTITQEEIDDHYQRFQAGYREPEQIRLRQLVLPSEEHAKAALVKLTEGLDFVDLAKQSSLRPEAAAGPLTEQWVMHSEEKEFFARAEPRVRDLRDQVLERAAFAIDQAGGLSNYVKGADGNFHIFQLIERKPGRQKTELEVADSIRQFLRVQKVAQLTDALQTKAQAKIERFPERLTEVQQ